MCQFNYKFGLSAVDCQVRHTACCWAALGSGQNELVGKMIHKKRSVLHLLLTGVSHCVASFTLMQWLWSNYNSKSEVSKKQIENSIAKKHGLACWKCWDLDGYWEVEVHASRAVVLEWATHEGVSRGLRSTVKPPYPFPSNKTLAAMQKSALPHSKYYSGFSARRAPWGGLCCTARKLCEQATHDAQKACITLERL